MGHGPSCVATAVSPASPEKAPEERLPKSGDRTTRHTSSVPHPPSRASGSSKLLSDSGAGRVAPAHLTCRAPPGASGAPAGAVGTEQGQELNKDKAEHPENQNTTKPHCFGQESESCFFAEVS